MKVFSLPDECPAPEPDYKNIDLEKERARQDEHMKALKEHLIKLGYNGPNTGRTVRFQVADGYALYMIADGGGRNFAVVHLPYWDAYEYRDIQYLPKKEILLRADQQDKLAKMFSKSS